MTRRFTLVAWSLCLVLLCACEESTRQNAQERRAARARMLFTDRLHPPLVLNLATGSWIRPGDVILEPAGAAMTNQPKRFPTIRPAGPVAPLSNEPLENRIRIALAGDRSLAPSLTDLRVRANDEGIVTLSGFLPSASDQRWVEEKVATLPGVTAVRNVAEISEPNR